MRTKLLIGIVFLTFLPIVNAQNNNNKWVAGLSVGSVLYSNSSSKIMGGAYIDQIPRLDISRYTFKNLTLNAGFSFSVLDNQKYITFDGVVRYDFGASQNNAVPYVLIGGSFINAIRTTPTLNFGVGNTFWFSPNYGLNMQLMYKYSEDRFESQRSHLYTTIGLVYSFRRRSRNPRLWDL